MAILATQSLQELVTPFLSGLNHVPIICQPAVQGGRVNLLLGFGEAANS